jgi:hypothetical protein
VLKRKMEVLMSPHREGPVLASITASLQGAIMTLTFIVTKEPISGSQYPKSAKMFLWPHFLLFLLKTDKVTQVPIG